MMLPRLAHVIVAGVVFAWLIVPCRALAAGPPQVVELFPPHEAEDVDPNVRELRIVFDRDMVTGQYSICGGGPTFPKSSSTKWVDGRTVVMRVVLEPDHDYQMSLNCPASDRYFQSRADDAPLANVPWSFSTAAKAARLSKAEQKKLNARCLKELTDLLRHDYAYYKLRDVNWKKLAKQHRKRIVSATSTRSWIKRVAKMLSEAEDMHIWLSYRGRTTPTHQRKIKRNVRFDGIKAALPDIAQRNSCVFTARTEDNVGYVKIDTLARGQQTQLEQVPGFLRELADCKALILDLRANGGGAEPLAMPIAAWFVQGEKVYAKHVYRDRAAKGGFGPIHERKISGNQPPDRFDRPVAVLTGPAIMSSCEAFLLMLKQGQSVTLIGRPSYGSSGNPKPHALENGVEVFIPSWKAMRPDGSCFEGEGIQPDIPVKAKSSAFKTGDPVLRTALKHLRKKTQQE